MLPGWMRRPAAALAAGLLALALAAGGCTAGSRGAGAGSRATLRQAEVHFASGETLAAYLEDAAVTPMTGGITQTPYYDASGTVAGYLNYARVDYIRWLGPGRP